ncbi:MAG TPA: hypothetical protein VHO46_01400 [Bacteroidales bacterium]|nr:hypothetical protein [Bacteroidales bacterium]
MLILIPSSQKERSINIVLKAGDDTLSTWEGKPEKEILRMPFDINFKPGIYRSVAYISIPSSPKKTYIAVTRLQILQHKPNEVKTDRLTGGLIVNKLPFFPFGFYTYSPVESTLPEEEVVKGFNMISPYQKILPETLAERKAYMDRCAQLGMKVHYNLLSVSGGGGVSSRIEGLTYEEKQKRLLQEISMFKDHPALLGWYIADEPNGYKIPPSELEEAYRIINENDPWHPVSIVFMAPFISAKDYEDALDIVMADPYPLPDLPVTMVGDIAGQLKDHFTGRRPVWMVPQAFGGGELWSREPTIQEIRSMTWQSIIRGATGIQYFVRQGPNYFPKSPATWAECGRMAMEVAEITPWLLSDEEPNPVETSSKNIIASSKLHDGKLIVMVVNKANEPSYAVVRIKGISDDKARSIFENRILPVKGGLLNDYLSPLGSNVYMIDLRKEKTIASKNMISDPGFEDLSSPGIPAACYARPGGDKGATYFLDSREHYDGDHSLRLQTPEYDKAVGIRFFPVKMKAGSSYIISLWAKSDPEQRFQPSSDDKRKPVITYPQYVELRIGDFCHSWFVPGSEWKQFVTFVTIPRDKPSQFKANLTLRMPGQGVAWIDEVKIIEEE